MALTAVDSRIKVDGVLGADRGFFCEQNLDVCKQDVCKQEGGRICVLFRGGGTITDLIRNCSPPRASQVENFKAMEILRRAYQN